jgi:hypothetical protein
MVVFAQLREVVFGQVRAMLSDLRPAATGN